MFKRYGSVLAVGLSSLFGLGGCVGYDGASDGASSHAQALGMTSAEESSILGALAQKPMTTEEIAAMTAEIERGERGFDGEWRTQASLTDSASKYKTQVEYASCASDINCTSLHCSQANFCLPSSNFLANDQAAKYPFECKSSRIKNKQVRVCAKWNLRGARANCVTWTWKETNSTVCAASELDDNDNRKGPGETDVDCGGASIYTCPSGYSCNITNDCAVGSCNAVTGKCDAGGGGLVDLGRFWTAPIGVADRPGRPYSSWIRLAAEGTKQAQIDRVNADTRRGTTGALIPAESQMAYQHDSCVKHLVANGCSPIAVEMRIHREAYQNIICDHASQTAVGILAQPEVKNNRYALADEAALGNVPLARDPYLCNHFFTRAASAIGHRQIDYDTWDPTDDRAAPFGGRWAGIGITSNTSLYDGSRCPPPREGYTCPNPVKLTEALQWQYQLERLLLAGAACSVGRTVVGTSTKAGPIAPAGFDVTTFCSRFAATNPAREGGGPGGQASADISLSDAEWAFVRANVPWWNNYDIYSIDPEGNPNKPANMNMQYGWDAMHPSYSFGTYALSWGVALVPTSTTYSFGTTQTVWGTTPTMTFGWTAW